MNRRQVFTLALTILALVSGGVALSQTLSPSGVTPQTGTLVIQPGTTVAQPAGDPNAAVAALKAAWEAYAASISKGDVAGSMATWAEDGEYIDDSGKVTRGKPAIEAVLKQALAGVKDSTLKLTPVSVKPIRPDVVLAEFQADFTTKDGASNNRFNSVWIAKDGKWLIQSITDLPESAEAMADTRSALLKEIAWLAGEWSNTTEGVTITLKSAWTLKNTYLLQDFSVKTKEGEVLSVAQRIGYDPLTGQLKSWFFDSMGGYGEGLWTRSGNNWIEDVTAVLPDGRMAVSTQVWEYKDEKNFVWKSLDKQVEGQPMADLEVKYSKIK